jgi:hypothetical protein
VSSRVDTVTGGGTIRPGTGDDMTDTPAAPRERELRLRYDGRCRDCGASLPAGTRAWWDSGARTTRCVTCPTVTAAAATVLPATSALATEVPRPRSPEPNWGVAGASAQRQFDRQEGRRRARLRAQTPWIVFASVVGAGTGAMFTAATHTHGLTFVLLGAALPVLKLLPTPQHIDAWRSGAAGERAVGIRLDRLRPTGVFTVHDRRVPGSTANIDHIAVSPAGVFVIDTKNVAGKVSVSRGGLSVAGRRRDNMLTGVHGQIALVQRTLADQALPSNAFHGVLCFTRADLPLLRPSPAGVQLLHPKGLARALRRPGPLTAQQIQAVAALLAQRLPPA